MSTGLLRSQVFKWRNNSGKVPLREEKITQDPKSGDLNIILLKRSLIDRWNYFYTKNGKTKRMVLGTVRVERHPSFKIQQT